jgi:acetyl-CoA carboxylase carboxyl transferase beta subunit
MALAQPFPLETPAAGSALPLIDLPARCPGCDEAADAGALRDRLYVCGCGYHLSLHAEAWIALVPDDGSWHEHWTDLQPRDWLSWEQPKPYRGMLDQARARGLNEAVRAGSATLGGYPIWLAVFDFRFVGGTLGAVAGERLARAMERAAAADQPFVLISASGGARMQEGVLALMQMAKVNAAVGRIHALGVPYISILTNPTYGGTTASLALLADVNIAEPGAAIGFTGPRVIRRATYATLPPGFQSAEFQLEHGQVDMVVPRGELRSVVVHLLEVLC